MATAFDQPLVVARNPARLVLRALGGAWLAGIGFWMTQGGVVSRRFAPETVIGIGWSAVLLGGLIMLVVAILIARTKPILVADREGVVIHPTFGPATRVAWRDMTGWGVARLRKESRLVIGLRDPAGFVLTLEGVRRGLALRQAQHLGSPVSVGLGDLMIDRDTLFDEFRRRFDAADHGAAAAAAPVTTDAGAAR